MELGGNVSRGCFSSDAHSESRGTSHAVSKSDSISKTLTYGLSDSHADSVTHGTNQSRGKTQSYGMGTQHGETFSAGEAFSLVNSKTLTETFGSSQYYAECKKYDTYVNYTALGKTLKAYRRM